MSAYNKLNGTYCGENAHLLHDILKDDWGFQGFVESDWFFGTRSTTAPNAGLDIEMPIALKFSTLAQEVQNGAVSQATIDAAVRRILRAQFCFRLDTDPPVVDPSQVETQAHKDLARDVAREAIVLLQNAGGVLPIDRRSIGSIVVVGALATTANLGDTGSSTVSPAAAVSPLAGIQGAAGGATVTHVPGPTFSPEEQATIAAAGAVVVVVGLDARDEGEGLITPGDRAGLALPRNQDQVVADVAALNPRTIVVLEGSGGVTMPWLADVEAVVMAWYPGEQGGTAIAEVLFGDINPSGKLPVVFANAESELPPFDNVSLAVTYDYYYGYRYLDRHAIAPLFPFGFGLSYTTFRYTNLTITPATIGPYGRVRVTAAVTNTGTVAGDEVVQLYIGYHGSRVDRPVRELKAFARVHLDPGQTEMVPLDVRAADVAYWDSVAGAFVAEPITYNVGVGPSSRELPLSGTFAITP
jgi:beta-glucosidase